MVLLRAGLSSFVSLTWYISWRTMSLADTYAIGFTAPLLMTLMAVPMLGERIRWRRLVSTLVGFGGVLIMLRPEGEMWKRVVPLLLLGIVVMALTNKKEVEDFLRSLPRGENSFYSGRSAARRWELAS